MSLAITAFWVQSCGIYSFTIPSNVSTISQYVFSRCTNLMTIIFEENSKLESVSAYLFKGCEQLQTITFKEGSKLEKEEGTTNLIPYVTFEKDKRLAATFSVKNRYFEKIITFLKVILPLFLILACFIMFINRLEPVFWSKVESRAVFYAENAVNNAVTKTLTSKNINYKENF